MPSRAPGPYGSGVSDFWVPMSEKKLFLAIVCGDQSVLFHSRVESSSCDPCGFGGIGQVALVFLEQALDVGSLDLMQDTFGDL